MNIKHFINHIENLPRPYRLKWARKIVVNDQSLKYAIQKTSDLITTTNMNNDSGSNFLLIKDL